MADRAESVTKRWRRRAVSIPAVFAIAALYSLLLPPALSLTLVTDVVLRRNWASTRAWLALGVYVACEVFGVLASLLVWLACGWRTDQRPFVRANYRLQRLWARMLLGGAMRLYGMRLRLSGAEALEPGPFLLFVRHASTIDTLLAANFVGPDRPFRLRYVIKRELLWDPCLDIVGQRIPNVFIHRGSGEGAREIDAIRALARDLDTEDGILIYPEGTRATEAKRAQALARIAAARPERLERVSALRHVLPPRFGGSLGLIAERPDVDVVVLAHIGLEGIEDLNDLWSGALIGRELRVHLWRVPAAAIPREPAAREAWLDREWQRLDEWIAEQVDRGLT